MNKERSVWRDMRLSKRHRFCGFNSPSVDIDFIEYDNASRLGTPKPIRWATCREVLLHWAANRTSRTSMRNMVMPLLNQTRRWRMVSYGAYRCGDIETLGTYANLCFALGEGVLRSIEKCGVPVDWSMAKPHGEKAGGATDADVAAETLAYQVEIATQNVLRGQGHENLRTQWLDEAETAPCDREDGISF